MVADIFLAKIYFTDLSDYKIRPVLIIRDIDSDVIVLQLTSQANKDRLTISKNDLIRGELKKIRLLLFQKILLFINQYCKNI